MYHQVGMSGQVPPMQWYGHVGYQPAFPQHGWENQNGARTQGSSSQGSPDGGNRFGTLAEGDGESPRESDVDHGPMRPYKMPTPNPAALQAARGESMDGSDSSQHRLTHTPTR